ncbi:lactosylceramide 4-alpha-galactosyltransferase-like isoform X2 [Homarus americanus]|uniref:lactosylceramide 4-alpha-galactosyltransferase-like isoform X2 n=1 Tax=Homarus americanus TaxID=6706 RepID=UPI001C464C98|nr:lactosylceramide 4-alpha-galactosyltransferase-like isoform X2 [Homarus americanus]XP_042226709.1 lactosylceramide 4-alpha-galactosyltransferase-like isoform X2 [Homarus americanus]
MEGGEGEAGDRTLLTSPIAYELVQVAEVKVEKSGWRSVMCTNQSTAPTPILAPLPKFSPSPEARNVFFLETTCAPGINAKMACAVESAARHHPAHQIHLALTNSFVRINDTFIQALSTLPNVRISTLDVDEVDKHGQFGKWLRQMKWAKGRWPEINLSDALRVGVVCSTGGIYLDLDMWIMGPLPDAESWLSREHQSQLTNSAFKLPKDHWFCEEAKKGMMGHFMPNVWGYNGPYLFQNTIKRFCHVKITPTLHSCRDLMFLDPALLFPIHYAVWEHYFRPNGNRRWKRPSNMVGIHLWNKLSSKRPLNPGDGSIVDKVAQENCPHVYKTLPETRQSRR